MVQNLDHTNPGDYMIHHFMYYNTNSSIITRDECCQYIINCSDPEYTAAPTYLEVVFLYAIAEFGGHTQQLDPLL